jgi:hypothetical protein
MSLGDIYRDPLIYQWYSTPFQHTETIKVIGGKALLTYIPDEFQRVQITGKSETTGIPQDSSQYKVNYQTGFVEFHSSVADNTSLTATYYARGIIKHPAARTMILDSGNLITADNVEDALQEIVTKINSNNSRITQVEQDAINRHNSHVNSSTAHAAESITFSSTQVTGVSNVKSAIEKVDQRINNIVGQTGQSNTEIVDSRLGVDGTIHQTLKNRLDKMENEQVKSNQQSTTIGHGLNIINANQNSPLDIRIEGRTLVNVSQNVLDPAKYYVLSDKKSKVKFADGTTYSGVAKFQGKAEKPILIRVSNFENKVSGSTVENPHTVKYKWGATSLPTPAQATIEHSQNGYNNLMTLNGTTLTFSQSNNGEIAHEVFSFNLIEAIERNVGKIPATDKVAWLKNNIAKLTCNWWGYGSSPSGYKASLTFWNSSQWSSGSTVSHGSTSVNKLTIFRNDSAGITSMIQSDGFVHFLAYADPSDGVTASTINTDYIELEIELAQNAQLWNPRFPLYEVDATEYANILTTWDENEVMRRYPMVESVQHVQNPYVIAEGENLLPPFTEWSLHANARVKSAYELELNAQSSSQSNNTVVIPILPNTTYNLSFTCDNSSICQIVFEYLDANNNILTSSTKTYNSQTNITETTPNNAKSVRIYFRDQYTPSGTINFKNPILTLGSIAKPFVPRNPSTLFAEVKLGALSDKKDILFKDGQDWKVTKWIEKDVVLDGAQSWAYHADQTGAKTVKIVDTFGNISTFTDTSIYVATDYKGQPIKKVTDSTDIAQANTAWFGSITGTTGIGDLLLTISDTDSGWGETYAPSSAEIKAYFWGWRMCDGTYGTPYNGTGTKTWYPIGDTDLSRATTTCPTSAAPTIAEGKIGYYKLSYVRPTPVTEVVTDKVEGDLVVNGATQIEVGSGVIVREKVTPVKGTGSNTNKTYYINYNQVTTPTYEVPNGSQLKNKTNKILKILKNSVEDKKWVIVSSINANGGTGATIPEADYDPTADYYVTYLLLDRHMFTTNVLSVIANYESSIKSVVDSIVAKQSDIMANQSALIRSIAELYKRVKALGG